MAVVEDGEDAGCREDDGDHPPCEKDSSACMKFVDAWINGGSMRDSLIRWKDLPRPAPRWRR